MDTVQRVEYFYIQVPDKPGEGARALATLRKAGVNLLAYSGFPAGRRAQLDFIPGNPEAFKQVAKQGKWKVKGPKRGLLGHPRQAGGGQRQRDRHGRGLRRGGPLGGDPLGQAGGVQEGGSGPRGRLMPAFRVLEGWGRLPAGGRYVEAAGVAVDSRDNVYVFNRGEHPLIVFDREGNFLRSWGEGLVGRAHSITIGPDGEGWLTDDGNHTIRKFTPEGRLLLTIRDPHKPPPLH